MPPNAMHAAAIGFAIRRSLLLRCAAEVISQHLQLSSALDRHISVISPISTNVIMTPPHLRNDVTLAQRLLRTPPIRAFMLDNPPLSTELELLTTPRPHFVITTSEVQTGALEGTIAMHYLGVPAFTDSDGLSGGLVVTSYAARTHPLHAPTVMADVRVGRYVRDNRTGDWCIITRSHRDHVTRLQYVRVRNQVIRERICLTCDTGVFDKGDILASVLFRCHDKERRTCPCAPPCHCRRPVKQRVVKGLEDAALSVMQEGAACWKGKVRVTVLSQSPRNRDIDECMDVTSSVQPTMDSVLAAQMARLAIIEKVNSATCIPRPITAQTTATESEPTVAKQNFVKSQLQRPQQEAVANVAPNVSMDSFDNVFMQSEGEVADHFLIPPENNLPVLEEIPMLPADPSTLPGGVELCLDGMDLEDDWCSFINSDRDATSGSSAQSSTEQARPFEMSKVEAYPVEPVAAREESEDADLCDGYHGCANQVSPVAVQTPVISAPVPPPISLQQQIDPQLQQMQQQMSLPQQARIQEQLSPQTSIPQQSVAHQSLPQQLVPPVQQQPIPPQPIPQQAIPAAPLSMFPAHVLPMMPTPQPWQQPFQPQKMAIKQEFQENSPTDTPDDSSHPMLHGRKLAPRPAGMNVSDGFIWQMGNLPVNQYALAARLEAMEKDRKAEERRKKNRQAAARSNARKKDLMDGIRAQIRESKAQAAELRKRESSLQEENRQLRERVGRLGVAM